MKKKIISIILSVSLCLILGACGSNAEYIAIEKYSEAKKNNPASFIAAENNRYSLSWDNAERRIVFLDKEKNIPWCYTPYQAMEKKYDADGYEVIVHPQISTPINITVFDKIKNISDVVIGFNGSVKKNTFSVNKINDGISITYFFDTEKISVTVDYILREDSLLISVDPTKVTEGESYMLTDVSIAPFFCSVPNKTEDTYLFVPSGSGALVYADKESEDVINISEELYGSDSHRPSNDRINSNIAKTSIPVYGAKNGNIGITAIIEEGSGAASINVNTGSKNIGYSAVYTKFYIRNYESVPTNGGGGPRTVYSELLTPNKISIGFYPIYDQEANYVGMANVYKKYLSKQGFKVTECDERILSLEILGGVNVTESILGVPYDTLFATSTVENAQTMIKGITDEVGINPIVQLAGFGENGLDIGKIGGNFKLGSKFGSKKDLLTLSEYCKSNDIPLYFDYDVLLFKKNSSIASTRHDSARTANGRTVSLNYYHLWSGTRDTEGKGWNNTSYFTVIKRDLIPQMLERALKSANEYNIDGISLSTLGRIAYSDNYEQRYYSKGQIDVQIAEQLKSLQGKGKNILLNNANAYAAIYANCVLDVPVTSSRYDIYDVDVPFYQLVFKGNVPLSTSPINASADLDNSILKAIESGTGLTFALSYNYNTKLIKNSEIRYFGSSYEQVKDTIIAVVNDNKAYYNAIKGAKISEHYILEDTLRRTVYDNGVEVYVNYSDKTLETPLGTLRAKSYIYKGGEN